MEFRVYGIKCDNCDYKDNNVQFSQYPEYVNKPCPNCGFNLLTKEEYENCLSLYDKVNKIKKICNILKWLNPFYYISLLIPDKYKEVKIKTTVELPKREI